MGVRQFVSLRGYVEVVVATCLDLMVHWIQPDWVFWTGNGHLQVFPAGHWPGPARHSVEGSVEAVAAQLEVTASNKAERSGLPALGKDAPSAAAPASCAVAGPAPWLSSAAGGGHKAVCALHTAEARQGCGSSSSAGGGAGGERGAEGGCRLSRARGGRCNGCNKRGKATCGQVRERGALAMLHPCPSQPTARACPPRPAPSALPARYAMSLALAAPIRTLPLGRLTVALSPECLAAPCACKPCNPHPPPLPAVEGKGPVGG